MRLQAGGLVSLTVTLPSSEIYAREVGTVRILVWNHAWNRPSQAPAGPEI